MKQYKRVRVVRRADGYYAQFCIDQERLEKREATGQTIVTRHTRYDDPSNEVKIVLWELV